MGGGAKGSGPGSPAPAARDGVHGGVRGAPASAFGPAPPAGPAGAAGLAPPSASLCVYVSVSL